MSYINIIYVPGLALLTRAYPLVLVLFVIFCCLY